MSIRNRVGGIDRDAQIAPRSFPHTPRFLCARCLCWRQSIISSHECHHSILYRLHGAKPRSSTESLLVSRSFIVKLVDPVTKYRYTDDSHPWQSSFQKLGTRATNRGARVINNFGCSLQLGGGVEGLGVRAEAWTQRSARNRATAEGQSRVSCRNKILRLDKRPVEHTLRS
jgi:hypothetical protein